MVPIKKWTSIELLHNLVRTVDHLCEDGSAKPSIRYRAKVKLDGTNAGVQVYPDLSVHAQSRSRIITPDDDNFGFAKWVKENEGYFQKSYEILVKERDPPTVLIYHGEWCGQGIQKRTAISKINQKVFAPFAIQKEVQSVTSLMICPAWISNSLVSLNGNVRVIPWCGRDVYELDFSNKEKLQTEALAINELVAEVEREDPFVKSLYGIEGIGEGVVMYPYGGLTSEWYERDEVCDLMFKAKGEEHQAVKQEKPAQIDPEVAHSIEEFVELMVTPARLEQGLIEACGGAVDMRNTGAFLKWVGSDVMKESCAELKVANLEWKQVAKSVNKAARSWFVAKAQEIS